MFKQYFTDLWFSENEAEVFKTLYILWTKPASTIAKYIWVERTTVYKILKRLVDENIIYETNKSGIKHFFIPDLEVLNNYVKNKKEKYNNLENNFDLIKSELQEFDNSKDKHVPKITFFDSSQWIHNVYEDIFQTAVKNNYISIRLFASNTIDSQTTLPENIKQWSKDLFTRLSERKINIETFLWNGIMLMENISRTYDFEAISKLPASNSAINIYIVWSNLYFLLFSGGTFWIKIQSDELAGTFHFLLDNIELKWK